MSVPAIHLGAEDSGRVEDKPRRGDAILVCMSAGQMATAKDETGSSEAVELLKVAVSAKPAVSGRRRG